MGSVRDSEEGKQRRLRLEGKKTRPRGPVEYESASPSLLLWLSSTSLEELLLFSIGVSVPLLLSLLLSFICFPLLPFHSQLAAIPLSAVAVIMSFSPVLLLLHRLGYASWRPSLLWPHPLPAVALDTSSQARRAMRRRGESSQVVLRSPRSEDGSFCGSFFAFGTCFSALYAPLYSPLSPVLAPVGRASSWSQARVRIPREV